jgi:hypothetical protein
MAVSVPTSEVIPIVMINTVRVVLRSWARTARSDILMFSLTNEAIRKLKE